MAFSALPTDVFSGWTEDGTNITLPIASVPELTAAEADAVSGDSRKVLYAICERVWSWFYGLAAADQPAMFTVTKSSRSDVATGVITHTYTMTFKNTIASQDVADEA